ncbi:enoyl-CoA delta isomerase 2, peroxisomal isoform X2 [Aplysia californica]|nr:enoyl-CoA delta isomerase 2, peroxisomal isoform X2 [Aplysia californica]
MSSAHLHKPTKMVNGLSVYYSGEIAVIVMDCGENRLNIQFCEALLSLLDDVEKNETCKGLITTGTGKFYGNGLDLDWMSQQSEAVLAQFFHTFMSCLRRILFYPLPTLAALNGHCYAGSGLLAFAHDFRTMRNDRGWLSFNEVFINRRFSETNYKMLRTKLGGGINFTDAVLLGRRYTATEAFNSGMLHAMPSQGLLIPESIRVLKSYYGKSGYPRESLANLKADIYKDVGESFDVEMQRMLDMKSKL